MRIQREHDAIRLFVYFLLAEPPKVGYSDDQLEEVLLREENKKRHAVKRGIMYDFLLVVSIATGRASLSPRATLPGSMARHLS